jgi:hypothetical protein
MALARLVACGVLRDSVLFLLIKDAYQSGPASRNLEMIMRIFGVRWGLDHSKYQTLVLDNLLKQSLVHEEKI